MVETSKFFVHIFSLASNLFVPREHIVDFLIDFRISLGKSIIRRKLTHVFGDLVAPNDESLTCILEFFHVTIVKDFIVYIDNDTKNHTQDCVSR